MGFRTVDNGGNMLRIYVQNDVRGGIGSGETKGSRKTKLGVCHMKVANCLLSMIKIG
jgi:hypothetical protein